MKWLISKFIGDGIGARTRRSMFWSIIDLGGSQVMRLASNLILTRLLYPEAFGLMALATIFISGLQLLSDTGVSPAIVHHSRGDDLNFQNTAWTVQLIRGVLLWIAAIALAHPFAALYDEPIFAQIIPVMGISMLIEGCKPTAVYSANRHLRFGQVTRIKLISQAIALAIMGLLAWQIQSVWSLVIGVVSATLLQVSAFYIFLPGPRNRLLLEPSAFWQIFDFGKWVFFSTMAAFLVINGDRAILGFYVSLETLGIYSIGFFLASAPVLLSRSLNREVIFPLYRIMPPASGRANIQKIFQVRRSVTAILLSVSVALAFFGPSLVELMYDGRYKAVGPMVTLMSTSFTLTISLIGVTYALLSTGRSREAFLVTALQAFFQTIFLIVGIEQAGIPGAVIAIGFAVLASHPLRLFYSIQLKIWDPIQEICFTLVALTFCVLACARIWPELQEIWERGILGQV